jgi:phosphopantothenoylcysteine decarboxylase/phosphopantothenate--cysteine ligase
MHTEMWEHPAVQQNLATLRARGVHVVEPEAGRLAGGDVGMGRLADPDDIVAAVERVLRPGDLAGVRVLVSAGGTREAIDPVRVITNRSSGKQGYALAEAARARGAEVTLVTTVDRPAPPGTHVISVASAADMQQAIVPIAPTQDVIVMAAAVADFRPVRPADHKIKKADDGSVPHLELERTHDFLVDLGAAKPAGQVLVGFAAETDQVLDHARAKLERKHSTSSANDVAARGRVRARHQRRRDPRGGRRRSCGAAREQRAIAGAILDEVVARRKPDLIGQL